MTTWHPQDILEEALWFLLYSAYPDDAFIDSCKTSYIVSVAGQEWPKQISSALSDIKALGHGVAG
jgi:hypothetical protein